MRVGIAVNGLTGGGAERQAALWATVLSEAGHDVVVLSARDASSYDLPAAVEVRYAGKTGKFDFGTFARGIRTLSDDTEAIAAFQQYPTLFCAALRISTPWMSVTGSDPRFHWTIGTQRLLAPLYKRAFKRAPVASAPTRGIVDAHQRMGIFPAGGWLVVPNIADEQAYVAGAEERSGALFVGRLVDQKDPLLAVEAATLAGVPLTVLGTGPLQPEVERAAAGHAAGLVKLHGFTPRPWELYGTHRVLVLSSRYEPFGNVIVEALAAGTPVVAVDCDFGPREIIPHARFSHIVPRDDPAALADALRHVAARPYGADEREECREIADRYRPSSLLPQIEQAIDRTIATVRSAVSRAA